MGWDHVKVLEDRINTLEEKVENIKSDVTNVTMKLEAPSSIIKSIQRGTGSGNATITINEVNPDKTIVLLNGARDDGHENNYSGNCGVAPRVENLSANTLTIGNAIINCEPNIGAAYTVNAPYSWQVVEFW